MSFGSILAVYFLFWVGTAFIMLPFGVKTSDEVGEEKVPGQADSAPHRFDLPGHIWKATIVASVLFALYYANWHFGWISVDALDFYN